MSTAVGHIDETSPAFLGVALVPVCVIERTLEGRLWRIMDNAADELRVVTGIPLPALAEQCDATVRGVQKALDRLEKSGLIVRRSGSGGPTEYLLIT